MRKLFILMAVVLTAGFTGCSFDDSDLWNELRDQEERLSRLEQKVESLNADIQSIRTIVEALQSQDMITSITELPDGSGYVINFLVHSPITIKHGQKGEDGTSPVIGVTEEDGVYYWTVNGQIIQDDSGNKLPVTGNNGEDGKDAVAPQLRINENTMEWEISTDGGITWESTGVIAEGQNGEQGPQGDSFFSDVDISNSEYVIFTLSDGTVIEIPRYTFLSLTFTNLNDGVFELIADGNENIISYTNTGTIENIGIASAVPAGWIVKADMLNNRILVSSSVAGDLQVLVVATSADGSSASYWISMQATNFIAPDTLQAVIDAAAPGDVIKLNARVNYAGPISIDKNISLIGGTGTVISAVSPAAVATSSYQGRNPVIVINAGVTVAIENVRITTENSPAGAQVDGLTILGDATATTVSLDRVVFDGIFAGNYSGAQNGRGVTVYGSGTVLNVTNSLFTRFNKNGIHVMEGTANVSGSEFVGNTDAYSKSNAAQNGIVFMSDALGAVSNCSFTDFAYGDVSNRSIAVLIYYPSDVNNVADGGGNTYSNCDAGWELYQE